MDWGYYFFVIQTEEHYKALKGSGMAWELFPNFPTSWKEHCEKQALYDLGEI